MPSENQQVLRLRLAYLMHRLFLIIQLIGLSALLLGSIVGSIIIIGLYLLFVGLALGGTGAQSASFLFLSSLLLILILLLALITLYWRFIVLGVFKHVRKSLRQKPNKL